MRDVGSNESVVENVENRGSEGLNRSLKSRHIQMIAIGGSVGVGIFLASAKMIQMAGPSVLFAYMVVGVLVYLILRSLGEMAVFKPVSGSFSTYANDYLGNFMGYLTGWSYWFLWGAGVMAEITAVGNYMKFWFEDVPGWIWALLALVTLTLVNLINVRLFGEIEFWFSIIKVVTIMALIVVGFAIIAYAYFAGSESNFSGVGFFNLWVHGGFFPKGIVATLFAVGPVAVSFIGVESIGLTAGETENPSKNLPRAINTVLFRILIFYIGSMLVIMSLFPWNKMDPKVSPFVLTFNKIGLKSAAGIINFVVLTAALSACNSGIFSSSRMMLTLQRQKNAPKFVGKLNSKKIPVFSVLFSVFFMLIGVVLYFIFPSDAFQLVFSMCGIAGFFIWAVILVTQIKFRKCLTEEQVLNLKYRSLMFPLTNYIGLSFIGFLVCACYFEKTFKTSIFVFLGWILLLSVAYFAKKYFKYSRS